MKDEDLLHDLRALLRHAYEASLPQVSVSRAQLIAMVDGLSRMLHADEEFRAAFQRNLVGPLDSAVLNNLPEPKDTRDNYSRIRWAANGTLLSGIRKIRARALKDAMTAEAKRIEAFGEAIKKCESMEVFDFFERAWIPVGLKGILKMFEGRADVLVRLEAMRADSSIDPPVWHVKITDLELGTEHQRVWEQKGVASFFHSANRNQA